MSTTEEALEVERARSQILAVIAEVERMAGSDISEGEFFGGLLDHALAAMEAVGGLVWLVGEGGRVEPVCHAGVDRTGIAASPDAQEAHNGLVQALFATPSGLLVPPRAQVTGPDGGTLAANATDLLVIAVPVEKGEPGPGPA